MPISFRPLPILLLALALFLAATGAEAWGSKKSSKASPEKNAASEMRVANGRISHIAPPAPAQSEAAPAVYFVLQSKSKGMRKLVGASSPKADHVSLRRTAIVEGQWGSEPLVDGWEIPAQAAVAFAPRGLFLRFVPKERIMEGDLVPIELVFDNGETLVFEATVLAPNT